MFGPLAAIQGGSVGLTGPIGRTQKTQREERVLNLLLNERPRSRLKVGPEWIDRIDSSMISVDSEKVYTGCPTKHDRW